MTVTAEVAAALRVLAAWAEQAAAATDNTATPPNWIDQAHSPAGRRRHINRVRELVATGSDRARIVGRKYLLTASAVDDLLGNVTKARRVDVAPVVDELAALRARLEKGRAA